jgi:hypothetical protein
MRATTQTRGRSSSGWSGISSACLKTLPTSFRCCDHWSIADPEGRSDCQCRAGVMNAYQRHCSRIYRSVTNPQVGSASPPAGGATAKPREGSSSPEPESPTRSPEEGPPPGDQALPEGEAPARSHRPPPSDIAASTGTLETVSGRRRPARYGLLLQFESRPADSELGRLVDSTIWINDAHPAFTRAVGSRSIGYHTALAVALALAPLAVEARDEHTFITQFLAHWGSAPAANRVTGRRQAKKSA